MTAHYRVLIDDRFHHGERHALGEFDTADAAIDACKRVVDDFLGTAHKPDMPAPELFCQFENFGDDPFIVALHDAPDVEFKGWRYAEHRAAELCGAPTKPVDEPATATFFSFPAKYMLVLRLSSGELQLWNPKTLKWHRFRAALPFSAWRIPRSEAWRNIYDDHIGSDFGTLCPNWRDWPTALDR
jgi:hypothetical protein